MRTLFGLAIPESATSVVVCPILGPGRTMSLYRGPLQEGESHVDEDFITGRVSANAEFWKYIDAKVREGKISGASGDVFHFKLSLKFLDSTGNACIVDPVGGETYKTAESFEFYRGVSSDGRSDLRAHEVYATSASQVATKTVEAGTAAVASVGQQATGIANAMQAPLLKAIEIIEKQLEAERNRANSATLALARVTAGQKKETDWVQSTEGVVRIAGAIKNLVN